MRSPFVTESTSSCLLLHQAQVQVIFYILIVDSSNLVLAMACIVISAPTRVNAVQ
jgi:hypothetical protein